MSPSLNVTDNLQQFVSSGVDGPLQERIPDSIHNLLFLSCGKLRLPHRPTTVPPFSVAWCIVLIFVFVLIIAEILPTWRQSCIIFTLYYCQYAKWAVLAAMQWYLHSMDDYIPRQSNLSHAASSIPILYLIKFANDLRKFFLIPEYSILLHQ